jgi:adenylate cyclase
VTTVFDWLLDGAPGVAEPVQIAERLAEGLTREGIPLDRVGVFVRTLHPNVLGRAFFWERGKPTRVLELTKAVQASPGYRDSPVGFATTQCAEVRWRRGDADRGWQLLRDLEAEGYADYLCVPLPFTTGEVHAVSFSTKAGFDEHHVAALRAVARPLARVAEIFALRRVAKNVLETYVGRISGDRVLAGRIFRGDVDTMRAAIWFSDLRSFTAMSSSRAPRDVIDTLNEVFECQVGPIDDNGGEVLKFIGDGLLAIFPTGDSGDGDACRRALDAAGLAFAALEQLNARQGSELRIGLALHLGEVAYGNIGGASRLDFTAIGPAVNLASRLEGIASKLERALVVSAEFAAACGTPCEELGTFELKGIPGTQQALAPRVTSPSRA